MSLLKTPKAKVETKKTAKAETELEPQTKPVSAEKSRFIQEVIAKEQAQEALKSPEPAEVKEPKFEYPINIAPAGEDKPKN